MENQKEEQVAIADEVVINKIYVIRGYKVMLDRDLADLYKVETKYLKRQVKRNLKRFPQDDFLFELGSEEFENWRCHFGTSNSDKIGLRYAPYAFTEQGVAMLSSVLNSDRAIAANIQIIRLFTKMREMMITHKDLLLKIEQLEKLTLKNTNDIQSVFKYLKQMLLPAEQMNRRRIGFIQKD